MVSRSTLLAAGAAVVGFLFLSGNENSGNDRNGGNGGAGGIVPDISVPLPEPASPDIDPVVDPTRAVTEGPMYDGSDPLDLAPGEGRGDLIAPVNPGNAIAGGPLYTGPDPLGLGGEGSTNNNGWVNSDDDNALWDGPDPLGLGGS